MHHSPNRGQIRPKFSSMPRQRSEAAAFLESYKLTVEKKRLQQELESLNQRCEQIQQRLTVIDQAVEQLDDKAKQIRASGNTMKRPIVSRAQHSESVLLPSQSEGSSELKTLFVDY